MAGEVPKGAVLQTYYSEHQDALMRQRNLSDVLRVVEQKYSPSDAESRKEVAGFFTEMISLVPATESEIPLKLEAANSLRSQLEDEKNLDAFLAMDLSLGMGDLRAGKRETPAALEVLEFARGLIGLRLQAIKEANAWMGRGGPPTMEANREMEMRDWREKYEEPVVWRDRDYEPTLMKKICNVLLTTGVDSNDVNGLLRLIKDRKSQYGSLGDFAGAIANLIGDERQGGPMKSILEVGSRSGVSIEGLENAISRLTPGDVVAFANLTWSFKIDGESRSLSVGQVLEKLLTLPGGRRAWTDPFWTGAREGADPLIKWMQSDDDDNPFRGAASGMELDPGFLVYPDGFPRKAGVMDGGHTNVEDIPPSIRSEKIWQALIDGSPAITLFVAARALGILTQPIQRLYGAKGIMEALPPIQKMWGTLYEKYYTNQAPFYRLRAFISLMSMTDRAVKSPLETIYPQNNKKLTMDGFAFMEVREQDVARGGVDIDPSKVEKDLKEEYLRLHGGKRLEGQELKFALNERLNKINVLLLNIFGCPIDDPGSFEQELAVARIVGAMNDKLVTPTCEEVDNPIQDEVVRRKIALARAREYFQYQIDLSMSLTDERTRSLDPLTNYVKYVHAPPEMIRHRLNLLGDDYVQLFNYVDFTGLLKRWKGDVDADPVNNSGVEAAKRVVDAMRGGVMATLPGGTKDLNTPFNQKQGGYWSAEYKLYQAFTKGYPISLQVLTDEAQRKAGIKVTSANEFEERAYETINELASALRGINANEKIRGGTVEEYLKWLRETAPSVTFIGGKAPVVTFFHIAASVAASMVGMRFVPPYLDKDKMCYVTVNGERKHAPVGVNDDVAEYGDFYDKLPDDILALVGVEKDGSGKALMSPGRITSIPVIGLEQGTYVLKEGSNQERYPAFRPSSGRFNPGEYAGSMKVFPQKPDDAYAVMLETTFNHFCDLGLVDRAERKAVLSGLTILPDNKYFKK